MLLDLTRRTLFVSAFIAALIGFNQMAVAEVKIKQYSKPKTLEAFQLQDGKGKPFGKETADCREGPPRISEC